jgi:hypothetical protein
MAFTYRKIASVTVGSGGAANIEFTSIPNIYDDLVAEFSLRSTRASFRDGIKLSLNGSTSNFSYRMLETTGSGTPGSYAASDGMVGNIPGSTVTASTFGSFELYIPNYKGSTNKSYGGESTQPDNSTSAQTLNMVAGLWSNTAAITSLRITADNGNLVQYSTATLYGILQA